MDWQPIETAPKDGRKILLFAKDIYGDKDVGGAKIIINCSYWYKERWFGGHFTSHYPPTHWQYLPQPPEG